MDFNLILQGAFLAFFTLFALVVVFQRARYKFRKRRGKKHLGFYPSAAALSLALLSLQTLAQPDLNHSLEQRETEAADEDDEGDPDDPAAQLSRQLKRIRNGETLEASETLKVPLTCRPKIILQIQSKNRMSSPKTT
ncbi:MAG TPA: hypothetical protein VH117_06880 [Edaphobacter sp.]|jgi:hypothetical protein|nr:hypothetical protein [Edaphobacter sp.]